MIDFARVRARGGLAYGLELAEQATHDQPVRVVPWTFVPLADLNPSAVFEVSKSLGSMVLRWSAAKDDEFTPAARRGDKQRQINAIPAGQLIEQVSALMEAAATAIPVATAGAVLQRSLDLSPGCLFDLEVRDAGTDIEFRTSSARLLVSNRSGGVDVERLGADERLPSRQAAEGVIGIFEPIVERLPTSRIGWHVEGAWIPSDTPVQVLQLRPIPDDRPLTQPISVGAGNWAKTRFVWGVFDLDVIIGQSSAVCADGTHVTVVERDQTVADLEETVVASLAAAEPVLLLNRAGGFRLTHEPFNLPEAKLRNHFLAVHLPETAERRCRIVSDGDTAYFARA